MHIDIYTHNQTDCSVCVFFPPHPSLSSHFTCLPISPSLSSLILFLLFTCLSTLPISPCNQLLFQTVSKPHFYSFILFPSLLSFSFFVYFPFSFSNLFSPRALSLSPSSFDGLVVGGTDSARLELLSQCEMCCCGDDMSHFTLDWWRVWEGDRERALEYRE